MQTLSTWHKENIPGPETQRLRLTLTFLSFRSLLTVHCNFLFFLLLHYERGHFKSKSYSSCKFYGHQRTPQETLILRRLWKFQRYEKKKTWLPTFTQLSPKKEIAKNKPNTPKVLFNNKRTLYEQDWCIKESHQFSQPPAKNIPLD